MATQVEYVATISALESFPTSAGVTTVIVTDPNQGGTFVYNSAISSGLADSVTTFPATGMGSGVWQRQFVEAEGLNVLWGGALGNGGAGLATITSSTTLSYISGPLLTLPTGVTLAITISDSSSSYTSIQSTISSLSGSGGAGTTITLPSGAGLTVLAAPTGLSVTTSTTGGWLPGNTYTYYIVAIANYTYSASATIAAVTNTTDSSSNAVSWNTVTGATAYILFRVPSGGSTTGAGYYFFLPPASGTSISYTDTGAPFNGYQTIPMVNIVQIVFGTDDTAKLINVFALPYNVFFPSDRTFYTSSALTGTSGSSTPNRKITAYGATILRGNTDRCLLFANTSDITIEGGIWTSPFPVVGTGTQFQHCFEFDTCTDIHVLNTHINGSPEMGVSLSNVITANIEGNIIENCYRDGISSLYSCYIKYLNNTIRNIKDDGMSMHDYGDASLKTNLPDAITQGGSSIVSGNIVNNCFNGFSSIGGGFITISNNEFSNTNASAVALFNVEGYSNYPLYIQSGIRVSRINVIGNVCRNNCATNIIFDVQYVNNNQYGPGRAAIAVVSCGPDATYNTVDINVRSNSVNIENNKIYNSACNAVLAHQVDGVTITNNYAYDCNTAHSSYTGNTYEAMNCTLASIIGNEAVDDRVYEVLNTIGSMTALSGTFTRISYTGTGAPSYNLYPTPAFLSTDASTGASLKKILITGAYNSPSTLATITGYTSPDIITVSPAADNIVNDTYASYGVYNNAGNGNFNPNPLQNACYSIINTSGYMDFWSSNAWLNTAPGSITGPTLINVLRQIILRNR